MSRPQHLIEISKIKLFFLKAQVYCWLQTLGDFFQSYTLFIFERILFILSEHHVEMSSSTSSAPRSVTQVPFLWRLFSFSQWQECFVLTTYFLTQNVKKKTGIQRLIVIRVNDFSCSWRTFLSKAGARFVVVNTVNSRTAWRPLLWFLPRPQ